MTTTPDPDAPEVVLSYAKDSETVPQSFSDILQTLADQVKASCLRVGLTPVMYDAAHTPVPAEAPRALVLLGGADIDPELYGEQPSTPTLDGINRTVDDNELALLHRTVEAGAPVLGICRGMQLLNVGLGGTLSQDIGMDTPHRNPVEGSPEMADHQVDIAPDSQLARIHAGTELGIRSQHHQAVKDVAPGLRATATGPGGVIEAVEGDGWVIGVQWHPEDPAADPARLDQLLADMRRQLLATSPTEA